MVDAYKGPLGEKHEFESALKLYLHFHGTREKLLVQFFYVLHT